MANLTITIANRLNVFAGAPATYWGNTGISTMTWGTSKWGSESSDFIQAADKLLQNALASDSVMALQATLNPLILNTLTLAVLLENLQVLDRNGGTGAWARMFPGETTNGEDRTSASYTTQTATAASYTVQGSPSTTWG